MQIGIVGPAERSVAWENHLQSHRLVSEVIIAATLEDMGTVDACFLLDESDQKLNNLLKSIKLGYHTFFISALPAKSDAIEKIYHASQEANVRLQFSHWPTLAPASQWMKQKVRNPSFIQVVREISHTSFVESGLSLNSLWIDELAYCLKYIGGAVHRTQINATKLKSGKAYAVHLMLRFDSGATAGIYISTCNQENRHKRLVSNHSLVLDCDVETQTVRIGKDHKNQHLFFEKKTFDPSLAAEKAAMQFLKAIQLNKTTLYSGYDLLQLTNLVESIQQRL
jgi:hypothetical protein